LAGDLPRAAGVLRWDVLQLRMPCGPHVEPTDFEYGERQYTAEDLAGHQWTFSETLAETPGMEHGGQTERRGAATRAGR
jgi:hypothetical protein